MPLFNSQFIVVGVLKKWQLIFYGTVTNPINLRDSGSSSSGISSSAYSGFSSQSPQPPSSGSFVFPGSAPSPSAVPYNVFHDYTSASLPYSGQGSEIDTAVSDPNGSDVESDNLVGAGEDSSKRVFHDCDEQCDSQGCYGKEPHQCISCKNYRLDNTCVSRCPPRSFPNSGGRCWPCHETCETCAGPGQDSCLTCAPAHLHVTDLAVCLQQCPEGYYESKLCYFYTYLIGLLKISVFSNVLRSSFQTSTNVPVYLVRQIVQVVRTGPISALVVTITL